MRVLAVFAGFVALVGVAFVVFVTQLPRGSTDCSEVAWPTAQQWRDLDRIDQRNLAPRLDGCGRLDDLDRADVEAVLGAPADVGTDPDGRTVLVYELWNGAYADDTPMPPDLWRITLDGDRVVEGYVEDV